MQMYNRGTMASLTPQIGLPRPSSNLGFAGERPVPRRPLAEPLSGRSPANPKCWMVLASRFGASGRLLCLYDPSASPCYSLIILLFLKKEK